MSDTHNADEVCPTIEDHKCKDNAKVWFSDAVLRVFKTYDERAALVEALRDEVEKVAELVARLRVYQKTSVPASRHTLVGLNCTDPSPEWWRGTYRLDLGPDTTTTTTTTTSTSTTTYAWLGGACAENT